MRNLNAKWCKKQSRKNEKTRKIKKNEKQVQFHFFYKALKA